MSIEEIIEPTMRPNSPINDISKDEWNYGRSILKGMKIHDVIVHSKKKMDYKRYTDHIRRITSIHA